jgi:RNA polymerase sigma-70 factor (ECF subfamily)
LLAVARLVRESVAMSEALLDTLRLQRCVERWQAGDRDAADELLRACGARLERLARLMLRDFPNVREWTETLDVLQGSLVRLLHTLHNLRPESTRHFFNLAAEHVRRELLDLARRFAADRFARLTLASPTDDSHTADLAQAADRADDSEDYELWQRFHEAVEQLPVEGREVIGLVFYHGWTQAQIAELFAVDERTVRRRWQSACLGLSRLVGQRLPQP